MLNDTVTHWLKNIGGIAPWIGVVFVVCLTLSFILHIVLQLLERRRVNKQVYVFLELTPLANSDKTPEATRQLFSVLHGADATRTFVDRLLHRRSTFSFEIVATKQAGIRYIVRMPEDEVPIFEQTIVSYAPDIKTRRVEDYIPSDKVEATQTLLFRQTGHFAYPLNTQLSFEQHDPIAYLTGAMTKLESDELILFQLVATPVRVREAESIAGRLLHNDALVYELGKRRLPLSNLFGGINSILFGILDGMGEMSSSTKSSNSLQQNDMRRKQDVAAKVRPVRTLSALEQELAESVNRKLQQPLFSVDIRALVIAGNKRERKQRANAIRGALDSFKVSKYQSLRTRYNPWLRASYNLKLIALRLPSLFRRSTSLLSAAEVADLYHFPHTETAKTENLVKSLSKTLPAPLAVKNGSFDVLLGQSVHHNIISNIGLTVPERERHAFIVGGTGNGKTTLMKYAIVQDIRNGKGVAVVDPHGDLAQELLAYIPEDRIKDVIYFNPADFSYPIGLNLLEIPEGLAGDQLLDAKDFIAETVVSVMRKTFSDDGTGGHRIEYVLRNAVLTALTVKDATLFTVYDLLTDKDFRKPIIKKLEQDWLRNFWDHEFGKAGDYQQVKMMSGVTTKIGRYLASVSAERILSQPKSTIDFGEILDGKILICNLAKGLIGEDTSEVLGISVLAELQLASFQRIKEKRTSRRPFYAYVDEFQNFATTSFVEMLSEARKYKLFLTMAEQTTSQQDDDKMVNTIMTNAGTIICFKSNSLADERQMLHLFNGKVAPGEISNLPAYNFYAKLSGGLEPQDPVSGMTVVLDDDGDESIAEQVITASRKNYAKKYVKSKSAAKADGKTRLASSKNHSAPEQLMTNSEG